MNNSIDICSDCILNKYKKNEMKIREKFIDKGNIYFMSDLHYNHKNVLKNDNRSEFEDVTSMNYFIENELKNKLKPDDILFDLGDLFWNCEINTCKRFLDNIPTKNIYKIMGNHDNDNLYFNQAPLKNYFKIITDLLTFIIKGQDGKDYRLTICHYPILDFPLMYHGGLHLFGHTHGHIDNWEHNNTRLMVDVGFNSILAKNVGSFIISFDDILKYFYKKTEGRDFRDYAEGLKTFNI